MNIQGHTSPFEIRLIGEAALRVLSNAAQGTVLASISNAIYLESQRGDLCWVIPMDAPMHQRAVKMVAQLPRLSAGGKYQVSDHCLAIDSIGTLDFRQSRIWKEPSITVAEIAPRSGLLESLCLAAEQALTLSHPTGLGCLIKPIVEVIIQHQDSYDTSFENRFAEKVWSQLQEIIQASRGQDTSLVFPHIKSLIGLGEGLTPSGDDFLGGFMYSLTRLQKCYSEIMRLPVSTYTNFIHQSKPLTNLISYSILMDHTDGHSVEPLHQLADGMLTGTPADELIHTTRRLISIGHSSGWDLLAGFVAGTAVAFIQ